MLKVKSWFSSASLSLMAANSGALSTLLTVITTFSDLIRPFDVAMKSTLYSPESL